MSEPVDEPMEIRVEGMSCDGCERAVETAARRVTGVASAEADHRAGTLRLQLEPGAELDRERLAREIREAGYEPAG